MMFINKCRSSDTSNFLVELSVVVALLDSYATEEWVQEQIAQQLDGEGVDQVFTLHNPELTTQLNALIQAFSGDQFQDLTNKPIYSNFVTQADIDASLPDLTNYVTNASLAASVCRLLY